MDKREMAVRLQKAAQERFGVKAKIKTGSPGDFTLAVNGKNVFGFKQEGRMPAVDELLRRVEGARAT